MEEATNPSWVAAVERYRSLVGPGWEHIPAFCDLVRAISASPEAAGLTAVTSHDELLISPYTRYPDWFDGRHVRLAPRRDGWVRVSCVPERSGRGHSQTLSVPVGEALAKVLPLLAEL